MARVVLTQPLPRVEALGRSLASRAHQIAILPFTRIEPLALGPLDERLAEVDWVVAVSPAAIDALARALGHRWPDGPSLALIGPGSLRVLGQSGLSIPEGRCLVPEGPQYDAAALMRESPFNAPAGLRVLVARGREGRDDWMEALRDAGAQVGTLALYERWPVVPEAAQRALLASWTQERAPVDCVFTQASAVRSLLDLPESQGLCGSDGCGTALVIHSRIAEAARAAGFDRVRLIAPGESAIAAAIE